MKINVNPKPMNESTHYKANNGTTGSFRPATKQELTNGLTL